MARYRTKRLPYWKWKQLRERKRWSSRRRHRRYIALQEFKVRTLPELAVKHTAGFLTGGGWSSYAKRELRHKVGEERWEKLERAVVKGMDNIRNMHKNAWSDVKDKWRGKETGRIMYDKWSIHPDEDATKNEKIMARMIISWGLSLAMKTTDYLINTYLAYNPDKEDDEGFKRVMAAGGETSDFEWYLMNLGAVGLAGGIAGNLAGVW